MNVFDSLNTMVEHATDSNIFLRGVESVDVLGRIGPMELITEDRMNVISDLKLIPNADTTPSLRSFSNVITIVSNPMPIKGMG